MARVHQLRRELPSGLVDAILNTGPRRRHVKRPSRERTARERESMLGFPQSLRVGVPVQPPPSATYLR